MRNLIKRSCYLFVFLHLAMGKSVTLLVMQQSSWRFFASFLGASTIDLYTRLKTTKPGKNIVVVGIRGGYRFDVFVNGMRRREVGIMELLHQSLNDSIFLSDFGQKALTLAVSQSGSAVIFICG